MVSAAPSTPGSARLPAVQTPQPTTVTHFNVGELVTHGSEGHLRYSRPLWAGRPHHGCMHGHFTASAVIFCRTMHGHACWRHHCVQPAIFNAELRCETYIGRQAGYRRQAGMQSRISSSSSSIVITSIMDDHPSSQVTDITEAFIISSLCRSVESCRAYEYSCIACRSIISYRSSLD